MSSRIRYTIQILFITTMLCFSVGGCNNHKKNQAMAIDKWKAARNNIALDLAGKQMANGQIDQAISTIQDTLTQSPELVSGWILLAQLYQQKDMPTDAEKCLSEALRLSPEHPEANYQMGMIREMAGDPKLAMEHYAKALKAAPDKIDYILAEAQLLATIGERQKAVEILQNQINLGRNNIELYITTGNIYLSEGKYANAIGMFKDALKKSPDNQLATDKLYFSLMKDGRYHEAIEIIRQSQLSQNRINDNQLNLALGDCYLNTGQFIMAQRTYETLIRDSGPKDEYLLRLAQATLARNDLDRAEVSCQRVLENSPDNEQAALLLATVYLKKQNCERATQISRAIIEKDQSNSLAWCILGRALTSQGQLDQAEACYRKAESLATDNALTEQLLKEIQQLRLSQKRMPGEPVAK